MIKDVLLLVIVLMAFLGIFKDTLGQNFLKANFKMADTAIRKIFKL